MPPDNEAKRPNADREWDGMRHALKKEAPHALFNAKRHIERIHSLRRRYG